MRKLFILAVALFVYAGAEAQVSVTVNVDEFTGQRIAFTESWNNFGEDRVYRSVINGYIMHLDPALVGVHIEYNQNLGCLSEDRSRLLIKLSNDKVIELSQLSDTDCSSTPSAVFIPLTFEQRKLPLDEAYEIAEANIKLLSSNDWVAMRIHGTRNVTDIHPKPSRRIPNPEQFFKQHIAALQQEM